MTYQAVINLAITSTRTAQSINDALETCTLTDLRNLLADNNCAARDVQTLISSALHSKFDLPELSGSDKQIAWATDIRSAALQSPKNDVNNQRLIPLDKLPADLPEDKANLLREAWDDVNKAYNTLLRETDSKFWIDNRDRADRYVAIALQKFMQKTLDKSKQA